MPLTDRPSLPQGQLLYAVGDIHGRLDLLETMLELIARDAQGREAARQKTLVFVGDYVDRGPDSRGVIERLIHDPPEGFVAHFLKGNHEAILLDLGRLALQLHVALEHDPAQLVVLHAVLDSDRGARVAFEVPGLLLDVLEEPWRLDHWLMNGGDATMRSYGVDIERLAGLGAPAEIWRNAFADALPNTHLEFFRRLKLSVSFGDYLFVHAGVKPGVPLDAQSEPDLIWIRAPFLDHSGPFGKIVVHGHTPERVPVQRPNRIGIDTGAVFSGRLTALRLEDGLQEFLQT